ncbi:MAG: hypothetical protein R3F50_05825 [Gammaproteobacteria bacterium]|jgi:hypothetical protein
MKHIIKSRLLLATTGLCSLLLSATASADYRVTAFGYSSEYDALLSQDVASAKSILRDRSLDSLDFVKANNLCVTQILTEEFAAAEVACSAALEKVEKDLSIGVVATRDAKASIYSNLAVALAMSGNIAAASAALETALSLNSRDKNAVANYSLVSQKLPASELAQSF